jgi:hypothetical protein
LYCFLVTYLHSSVQRAEGLDKLAWTHGLPTQQRQQCLKQTQAMLLEAIAANQPATKKKQY